MDHEQDHALHCERAWAVRITLGSFAPTNTQKQLYNEDKCAGIDCDHLETAKQNKHLVGKKPPDGDGDFWNSLIALEDYADDVRC